MEAPESAVIVAGVGATIHLIRLSIDLVSTASGVSKTEEAKIDEGKTTTSATKEGGGSASESVAKKKFRGGKEEVASVAESTALLSNSGGGGSGLGRNANGRVQAAGGGKPGGGGGAYGTGKGEGAADDLMENGGDSGRNEKYFALGGGPISVAGLWEERIPPISMAVHVALLAYFVIAAALLSTADGTPARLYGCVPLGCAAASVLFGIVVEIRDYRRARFGPVQRTLSVLSSSLLLVGCAALLVSPPPAAAAVAGFGGGAPTAADLATLVCLFANALLAWIEGRVVRSPEPPVTATADADGGTGGKKKARLHWRALLVLLKPYFWPDATSTSASLNRARAVATWVFVILAKACALTSPVFLGRASTALTRGDSAGAVRYTLYYCGLQWSGSTFKECQSLAYLKVSQAAFVQLSEAAFNHLHSLSLDWHLCKKLGTTLRQMDRGISACNTLMRYMFLWLVPAITECVVISIIFATYFDYLPLAVAVFFFVFAYVLWTILVTLWRKKFRKQVAISDNEWHDRCTDSLVNFETVKFFTAEEYEKKRFAEAVETFQSGSVNVQASLSFLNISQQMMLQLCLATSLSLAAVSIKNRMDCCVAAGCDEGNSGCCTDIEAGVCTGLEIGDFVTVLTYTLNLFQPLNFLGSVYNAIVMSMVDLANLSELLAETPDVVDAPDAMTVPMVNRIDPDVAVEFDNVHFRYPTQPENAGLRGLSFKMKRGTVTAVVGATGEGKTTVSRLLFRFYDVIGGAVKVNGVDVRALTQKSLRGTIGVVPQNTTLFNDTLEVNIRYGNREAVNDELNQVVDDAQLRTFVESLPEGLNTMVGDRGLKLSGGEKQRTAIARCLLKNPPIVVLDEATSSLDTITENSVQEALDGLGADRTCLVIAHRLGTIRNADNIIVLGGGQVAEQGTHDELLALEGKYAEMWNMQLHSTRGGTSMDKLQDLVTGETAVN